MGAVGQRAAPRFTPLLFRGQAPPGPPASVGARVCSLRSRNAWADGLRPWYPPTAPWSAAYLPLRRPAAGADEAAPTIRPDHERPPARAPPLRRDPGHHRVEAHRLVGGPVLH